MTPEDYQAVQAEIAQVRAAGEADKQQSFLDQYGKKPASAVGDFMLNLPKNITVGAIDAVLNTSEALGQAVESVGDAAEPGAELAVPDRDPNPVIREITDGSYAKGLLVELRNRMAQGSSTADEITQGIAQFVLPFTAWSKAIGGLRAASKVATAAKIATAESATAATALQPHEGRFADLLQISRVLDNKFGEVARSVAPDGSLANAYIEYMVDRENETDAEGRFKNVVDNLAAVGAVSGLIKAGAVGVKAGRRMLQTSEPSSVPVAIPETK